MIPTTWTPPDDPNPSEILSSAVDDTRNGLHEQALHKFLWYHHNALRHETGLYGVRLSFALGYWLDLASVFPPAHDAFIRIRDETEVLFWKDPSNFHLFHDLASMSDFLGEGMRTAQLFVQVADTDPAAATRLYNVAEPYLIATGRYRVCGPYLDPRRVDLDARCYRLSKQLEESHREGGFAVPKLARPRFTGDVAALVALLVLNDRVEDARTAYNSALAVIDDDQFRTILDAAMSGHLPERRASNG